MEGNRELAWFDYAIEGFIVGGLVFAATIVLMSAWDVLSKGF